MRRMVDIAAAFAVEPCGDQQVKRCKDEPGYGNRYKENKHLGFRRQHQPCKDDGTHRTGGAQASVLVIITVTELGWQ